METPELKLLIVSEKWKLVVVGPVPVYSIVTASSGARRRSQALILMRWAWAVNVNVQLSGSIVDWFCSTTFLLPLLQPQLRDSGYNSGS